MCGVWLGSTYRRECILDRTIANSVLSSSHITHVLFRNAHPRTQAYVYVRVHRYVWLRFENLFVNAYSGGTKGTWFFQKVLNILETIFFQRSLTWITRNTLSFFWSLPKGTLTQVVYLVFSNSTKLIQTVLKKLQSSCNVIKNSVFKNFLRICRLKLL